MNFPGQGFQKMEHGTGRQPDATEDIVTLHSRVLMDVPD